MCGAAHVDRKPHKSLAARGLRRFPGDMLGRLPFQFVDQPCPGIVEAQRDVSPIVR